MDPFFQDNHASDQVKLVPVPEAAKLILAEAKSAFEIQSTEDKLIGGANINSLNFKCEKKYVKLIEHTSNEKDYILKFPRITAILSQQAIPVCKFQTSRSGNHIERIENDKKKYMAYAQDFSSTMFYEGDQSQLLEMISIINRLRTVAPQLSSEIDGKPYDLPDFTKLKRYLDQAKAKSNYFEEFISEHSSLIESSITLQTGISDFEWGLFHADLHPHNILTNNGSISAIIDLESFSKMPKEIFEAFSIFKLARKSVSKNKLKLDEIKSMLVREGFRLESLFIFSQFELIRRISIILKLHYESSDTRWDSDISKQVIGLRESRMLFS